MSKIIEVDTGVLETALLRMWWKGFNEFKKNERWNDDQEQPIDLKHLDEVWEEILGGKVD